MAPDAGGNVSGYAGPAWPALALLETGENPLWFELGPGGPSLIESPETASLAPYVPWPVARFVVGIQAWDHCLVMAVNREGFLVLGPAGEIPAGSAGGVDDTKAVLYRAADGGAWAPYTVESFFIWKNKPAALLYRNDFFVEPVEPSPRPQVFILDRSSPAPVGAAVSALEHFPPGDGWEAELLRQGSDGFWYYRMKQKGKAQNETAYFRSRDLEGEGEKISADQWRNSGSPEGPKNIPPLLSAIFDSAAPSSPAGVPLSGFVLRAISTDFEGERFYSTSASAAGDESQAFLYVYCREKPEPLALAMLPDGRLLYSCLEGKDSPSAPIVRTFSLPALPEDFVYTGVALLGNIILGSWEEQQEAGIGAAGFMVKKFP